MTNPTVREILEMQYQFDEPFIVDSTPFASRLGMSATPVSEAVEQTLAAYVDATPQMRSGVSGPNKGRS